MSFLNSYSFGIEDGYNELPEKVLRLFTSIEDFKKTDCTCEVITAGMRGKIDFSKPFNLIGYDIAIHKNMAMKQKAKLDKEISVEQYTSSIKESDNSTSSDKDLHSYASYLMFQNLEDEYDKLNNEDELKYAIKKIKGLRESIIYMYGFDIIIAIRQALNHIPESVAMVKNLCEKQEDIAEYIRIILSSNYSFNELFVCE